MMKGRAYAAVRTEEGREWLDISVIGYTYQDAEEKVTKNDNMIPEWAKANPVVRIAEVEIREVRHE